MSTAQEPVTATSTNNNTPADVKVAEPTVVDAKEPQKAEATVTATKTETAKPEVLKYFAIGSMMNPTSLSLRDIHPTHSAPGELKGFKLVFQGGAGMGNIEEDKDGVAHGVVHTITNAEMLALDKIEAIYSRLSVDIHLYDGNVERATVYQFDPVKMKLPVGAKIPYNPPSERYVDIISRGAKHYGVKQEFIDWLATVKVTPRTDPKEYKKLPEPADCNATMTLEELSKFDGEDGRELCFACNSKVLKFTGDRSLPGIQQSYDWAKLRYSARDITCQMAKMLYEPKYPVPESVHTMGDEHRAYIENQYLGWATPGTVTVIAKLVYDKTK